MNAFFAALWAETLKARRSKITLLTAAGFLLLPFAGGLFMVIMKNPEQFRAMGLLSTKAQLTGIVADWPSFLGMLLQGVAGLGALLFAIITAWIFGREFSDHTVKELLALPTPRGTIISSKFVLTAIWALGLTLMVFVVGLGIGIVVGIPGWSSELVWTSFLTIIVTSILTIMLMPFAALFASMGRGYLPPMGWTILALAFANVVSFLGWGDWFPWAIPVLVSGMVKPHADQLGPHSYLVVLLACIVGITATFNWWRSADQAR
jgi:ABC-2 type transport system permease protein